MKTIRDAIHGDMEFDELEIAVLDSACMQRLRGVKQLGTSSLVFPGAVHTRFEHSLGTCFLAKKILDAVSRRGRRIDPADRRTAALAALLHDVTHTPFGHTFEDERRLFDRHDEDPARLDHFLNKPDLAAALQSAGEAERVRGVLRGDDKLPPLVRQVVSGGASADLLDYLHRDAVYCGLNLRFDERLFQLFDVIDGRLVLTIHKHGVLRRDAVSEIVHLLQMRYALTERVYYHHAKVAAGAMVSRALEIALAAGAFKRDELFRLRDDAFLFVLEQAGARIPELVELVRDLMDRRLYKAVYTLGLAGFGRAGLAAEERDALAAVYHFRPADRAVAERELAAELGVPSSHVIVYCPSPKMSLKEADAPVEIAPGVVQPLSELGHPDVASLKEKHAGLWRFAVFLKRTHAPQFARAAEICAERFGNPSTKGKR